MTFWDAWTTARDGVALLPYSSYAPGPEWDAHVIAIKQWIAWFDAAGFWWAVVLQWGLVVIGLRCDRQGDDARATSRRPRPRLGGRSPVPGAMGSERSVRAAAAS